MTLKVSLQIEYSATHIGIAAHVDIAVGTLIIIAKFEFMHTMYVIQRGLCGRMTYRHTMVHVNI